MALKRIGIKDFKNQATQLLRQVREHKDEIIVTHDGEPVAILRPYHEDDESKARAAKLRSAMERADTLAQKIAKSWASGLTATEAVDEQRR